MAKSLLHRVAAVSMALLVFMSSTGFSIGLHYCQDELKGISLFGEAGICCEKQAVTGCHPREKPCYCKSDSASQPEKDNCCHNESIVISSLDTDATALQHIVQQDIKISFVSAFVVACVFSCPVQSDCLHQRYRLPLPDRDMQVLFQTFLI